MRKYTKIIAGICLAFILATSVFAADSTAVKSTSGSPVAVETVKASSTSLFNAGEFGFGLGSGYIVDRAARFQQAYDFNLEASAFYYPLRNLGVEATVPFYQAGKLAVNEVQLGGIFRLPLGKKLPVFKNVAPYAGLAGVWNWENSQDFAYIAKAGVELRLNKNWGVFGEYQYRNSDFDFNKGQDSLKAGLHFVF